MSKLSGVSRLVDIGLPGVAMEMACGWGDFVGGPSVPIRLTADGGSGISCCIRLALNSPIGNGGGAEGFGIGGADGGGLVNPSRLICGDTTTEPHLDVNTNPVSSSARQASGEDAELCPYIRCGPA